MFGFMNDCLIEKHGLEINLMTFYERATQQLIKLDEFIVVKNILWIKHVHIHTIKTNINMSNNVIWPFTQNILKITGIVSLKFGTRYCLQGTSFFLRPMESQGLQNASPQIEPRADLEGGAPGRHLP